MGYFVEYNLRLRIKAENIFKAIELCNQLHTPEMLEQHARGGRWPNEGLSVVECKWYSWVSNPTEPYVTLQQAFDNWSIVDDPKYVYDDQTGDFIISGHYDNKLGQQEFLLEQLACVIENTEIVVFGEDGQGFRWVIDNYQFQEIIGH